MLNLPSCVALAGTWSAISWQLFDWLTTPALVIPLGLVSAVLFWLVRRFNWQGRLGKRHYGAEIVLLLIYLMLLSPSSIAASSWLMMSLLPKEVSGKEFGLRSISSS